MALDTTLTKRYKKSEAVLSLERLAMQSLKAKYPTFPYHTQPKYRDDTANTLTNCIVDYIEFRGFAAERINTMGQQIKSKGKTRWIPGSSKAGSADIHACIQGRFVAIEVKCLATKDTQSEDQIKYQEEIEKAKGVYLLISTFEQFYNWFHRKKLEHGR
jgi:hypothetical protein